VYWGYQKCTRTRTETVDWETVNMARDRQESVHRKGIIAFLAIAFGFAWLPFLILLVKPEASQTAPLLMPIAPAIASFIVRKWITREGFGDAGLRLNLRRWPLYLVALLWPLAVVPLRASLALTLHVAPEGFAIPWGLSSPAPGDLLAWSLGSILLAPIIFGEEFGWRGYLQLRLLAHRPMLAALATGPIWGVWHYPLILIGGEPVQDRLETLILLPISTTILSILLGWLRLRTGSVWAGSVAHAANNGLEDNLNSLAFAGRISDATKSGPAIVSLLAEAIVVLGIVAGDGARRRNRATASPLATTPRFQHP
jgi:uncharacterized protein